ncbi:MAG: hypothetical protein M3Z24_09795 [Chloroflexota bacterium]|nr:hypothetical protein [Chloroflexota bacterium]
MKKLFSLLPLVTFAMLVMVLAAPTSAGAASVGQGHAHVAAAKQHKSSSSRTSNLLYHGGPVMGGTSHDYAIFWEPTGSYVSSGYNSLITRYFNDVGGSGLYHNNSQYSANGTSPTNSTLASSWVDTASYPSGTITDAQVQAEVTHAQQVNGWSSSINNVFFVFTAKNENICYGSSCSFTTFCAYHSSFGNNTLYAAMPYTGTSLSGCGVPTSPNNNIDADSTINVTSHEQMEAATDPLGNAWYDRSGNENGDKCNFNFGPGNGDVVFNGHPYEVQKEWDNQVHGCVLSGP